MTLDPTSPWSAINTTSYDTAVYDTPFFAQVYADELSISSTLVRSDDVVVEVGCGSAPYLVGVVSATGASGIGVDINEAFLDVARSRRPDLVAEGRLRFVSGDASQLTSIPGVDLSPPAGGRRVVTCVMNTLGIMVPEVRERVALEIGRLAGPGGLVLLGLHNATHFERSIEEFYRHQPDLCGTVTDEDVDFVACRLLVPATRYLSQWFTDEEALLLAARAGLADPFLVKHDIETYMIGTVG